jgi:hypothetical protein
VPSFQHSGRPASVPALKEGDIGFARIVEVQRLAAATAGWKTQPRPVPTDRAARFWWQVPALRHVAMRTLPFAAGPLVPVPVIAAALGHRWWIAVTIALAVGALELLVLTRNPRRVFAVRNEPARPWRYVRFVDPAGTPGLMLFSAFDDGAPAAVLPLTSHTAADGVPVDGVARVHGAVRAGAAVLPVIGGHAYWPSTPAVAMPPAALRNMLNRYLGTMPRPAGSAGQVIDMPADRPGTDGDHGQVA